MDFLFTTIAVTLNHKRLEAAGHSDRIFHIQLPINKKNIPRDNGRRQRLILAFFLLEANSPLFLKKFF